MTAYKDEVLEKYVVVQFLVEEERSHPFLGRITQVRMRLNDSGELETEHFVEFEDGDKRWFDLQSLERLNHLTWVNDTVEATALAKPAKKEQRGAEEQDSPTSPADSSQQPSNRADPVTSTVAVSASRRLFTKAVATPRVAQSGKVRPPFTGETSGSSPPKSVDTPTARAPNARKIPCAFVLCSGPAAPHAASRQIRVKEENGKVENAGMADKATTESDLRVKQEEEGVEVEEGDWLDDFQIWMATVPHGINNAVSSEANIKAVMKKVRQLASGQGLACPNWQDDNIKLFENVKVNMTDYNFKAMLVEAKEMEKIYGRDKNHGYSMRHPLRKLYFYKMHLDKMSTK